MKTKTWKVSACFSVDTENTIEWKSGTQYLIFAPNTIIFVNKKSFDQALIMANMNYLWWFHGFHKWLIQLNQIKTNLATVRLNHATHYNFSILQYLIIVREQRFVWLKCLGQIYVNNWIMRQHKITSLRLIQKVA